MGVNKQRPVVMVFAASDGSGGAGVLADCRTLNNAGCLPLAVFTAVTAQNLNGVVACWRQSPAQVREQFAVLSALPVAAVKIGVVGRAAAVVGRCLDDYAGGDSPPKVVWDPVLSPTQGDAFASATMLPALRRHLLRKSYAVTPNRRELLLLSGERRVASAVKKLLSLGAAHVLVTDIDGRGTTVRHALFAASGKEPLWEVAGRRFGGDYHGSGCLFSTTLAAHLAHGVPIVAAAAAADKATRAAIKNAVVVSPLGRQKMLMP